MNVSVAHECCLVWSSEIESKSHSNFAWLTAAQFVVRRSLRPLPWILVAAPKPVAVENCRAGLSGEEWNKNNTGCDELQVRRWTYGAKKGKDRLRRLYLRYHIFHDIAAWEGTKTNCNHIYAGSE